MARPGPPGRLTTADRDRVAALWAAARSGHRWGPVADLLTRLRDRGRRPGVGGGGRGQCGVRARGGPAARPGPGRGGGPPNDAGWVPTADAAGMLGVSTARLEEQAAAATAAEVSAVVGWHRAGTARHCPPGGRTPPPPTTAQVRRAAAQTRAARVRAAVAAGGTRQSVADAEGVHPHTVWRDLRATDDR